MIFSIKITIKDLTKAGKAYNWKDCECPSCLRKMWGHGFVLRYFSECEGGLFLKRYRCPKCGMVATTRPEGYWARIRSSIASIYSSLRSRLTLLTWPAGFPRQRGGHWLGRFVELAKMESKESLSLFLDFCISKQLRFFA